jgi:hypothetical protein
LHTNNLSRPTSNGTLIQQIISTPAMSKILFFLNNIDTLSPAYLRWFSHIFAQINQIFHNWFLINKIY